MKSKWTNRELARAIELRLQGNKWAEAAAKLNRSESALWVKLSKLEVKIRADGRDEAAIRENLIRLRDEFLQAAMEEEAAAQESEQEIIAPEETPVPAKTLADTTVEEDMAETRRRILMAEARESKRKYQEVLEERALEDRLVDVFRERLEAFLPTAKAPPNILMPVAKAGGKPESAVLLVSDTHIGQEVSTSQTNGFGRYNPRIYCERLFYLQEKVIEIIGQVANGVDELHVLFLGDIIHGALNHGAEKEDNCVVADQYQLAVWTLHQFLCALALRVPSVQVRTVVGNHGRWPGQKRMPTNYRYSNLDHLVYSSLQHSIHVHGLTNIQVHLNDAPRQVIDIKGSRFLASHGDDLKGGDRQFGVPIHAATRQVNATTQRFAAAEDRPVDYYVCGDKHKSITLPLARGEFIVNGSMVGTDEFAMSFCPGEPMQLLFGVHPQLRKTWSYPIKVLHAPPQPTCPYHLPGQVRHLVEEDNGEGLAA